MGKCSVGSSQKMNSQLVTTPGERAFLKMWDEMNSMPFPSLFPWGPGKENWKLETLFSLDSHYFRRSSDGKRLRWCAYNMLNELFSQLGGRERPVSASHGVTRNENFTKRNNWDPN
jgi:hypothetical protein